MYWADPFGSVQRYEGCTAEDLQYSSYTLRTGTCREQQHLGRDL